MSAWILCFCFLLKLYPYRIIYNYKPPLYSVNTEFLQGDSGQRKTEHRRLIAEADALFLELHPYGFPVCVALR